LAQTPSDAKKEEVRIRLACWKTTSEKTNFQFPGKSLRVCDNLLWPVSCCYCQYLTLHLSCLSAYIFILAALSDDLCAVLLYEGVVTDFWINKKE